MTSTAGRAPGLHPGARDSPTNAQPEQVIHRRTKGQLVRKTSDRKDDQCAFFFSLAGAAVNQGAMELRQAIQEKGCMATNLAAVIETPVPTQRFGTAARQPRQSVNGQEEWI